MRTTLSPTSIVAPLPPVTFTPPPIVMAPPPPVVLTPPPVILTPLPPVVFRTTSPVPMQDQPELTPEWEAFLKQLTPQDAGVKRRRVPSPTYGKNYPTKKALPFSTPGRTPQISREPSSSHD